jgi:hypothetical protein
MNEDDFKKHLKDLVHGHHHPEEHDWQDQTAAAPAKAGPKKATAQRRRPVTKRAGKK